MNRCIALLTACALVGCTVTHAPPPDCGLLELEDGGPPEPATFSARLACGLIGRIHRDQTEGGAWLDCPADPCPLPYDSADPTSGRCEPAVVEDCLWALEGANDCAAYRIAVDDCAAAAEEGCR